MNKEQAKKMNEKKAKLIMDYIKKKYGLKKYVLKNGEVWLSKGHPSHSKTKVRIDKLKR